MKDRAVMHRRSILCLALAGGALGSAGPALAQSDTVRARMASTLEAQVERLAREIMTQRRVQAELQSSYGRLVALRAQGNEKEVDSLLEQIRMASAAQLSLRRKLQELCSADEKPRGWLGVTLQGQLTVTRQGNGSAVFIYDQHPRVESVEPGSPAAKAGIHSGDVIVALGGRDIRTDEVIPTELLRPGVRLPVRVRRANGLKVLNVRIEPRPDGFADAPCPWMDASIAAAMAPPRPTVAFGFVVSDSARVVLRRATPTPRPGEPMVASTPVPALAPVPAPVYVGPYMNEFTSGGGIVAGAQLMPMNPDLGANFGVEDGLLVLQVLQGTLAQNAGLKSGDVLLSANDHPLTSATALQRELSLSAEHAVKVVFVRKRERQTVVLRW